MVICEEEVPLCADDTQLRAFGVTSLLSPEEEEPFSISLCITGLRNTACLPPLLIFPVRLLNVPCHTKLFVPGGNDALCAVLLLLTERFLSFEKNEREAFLASGSGFTVAELLWDSSLLSSKFGPSEVKQKDRKLEC